MNEPKASATFADAADLLGPPVWAAPPHRPAPLPELVRWVLRREVALLRARGHVTRVPPPKLRSGRVRTTVAGVLRHGAIAGPPPGSRPIDAALADAGADAASLRIGSGGGVVGFGDGVVVRAGRRGGAGDPTREVDALAALSGAVTVAPVVLRSGEVGGVAWCVEALLPGSAPARLTDAIARQVAAEVAHLPAGTDPTAASRADVDAIAAALPRHERAVRALHERARQALSSLPAVARHGDLWAGNLLVDGNRLSGIVDWDAFHPSAAAGTDLLHLVATEVRLDRRWSLGATWSSRPHHGERYAAITGRAFSPPQLDAIAVAWWAGEVAGTLRRTPELAHDSGWVGGNVGPVLARGTTS